MEMLSQDAECALGVEASCGREQEESLMMMLAKVSDEAMKAFLEHDHVGMTCEYDVWKSLLRWARCG